MATTKKSVTVKTKVVKPVIVKTAAKPSVKEAKIDKIIKKFVGVVVSDKMDKTIVVKVDSIKIHPKYHKRYAVSRKYKVHDEDNRCHVGEQVTFIACRPMSKDKKWRVLAGR
ncbi:30S ribosomal protein S17 [Candidatus Falkowbacteria bacterium CG10_big_fil_rev_8_21_14_0_10_37_14]|uniref:Small ribosomal subunit protein uS17 n=1 Tax=Candidatus Falkowbacteria bacterium CG10_big_fil_rev_8_21_14_0_10_37_14 TaxID=1974561 RepID=A0A2M6WTX0_9BACT|nr:30S ribosomal protein S17 [Candidatus Falkowbacteria bacterium]PIT96239.1 MAG: 30S ribosomal protein S17 [Candidatus Falkowbacteria bacterium CG10_big_fil_rev_8_21_14_0_10_37_14]